jgi:F0F1-type ATP synthase membrane subunit b/b'
MPAVFVEALQEITRNPTTFAIELVQFGVLVLLIKAVGFGWGKRPGMVTNMLADRRERVRVSLEEAASADEELIAAHQVAQERLSAARTGARTAVSEARRSAEEEARRSTEAAANEVAEIRRQGDETLAKERAEMLGGVHEQLVDLVTLATRQVLDEGYTAAEQRALIQKSVVESLDDLESVSLR